MNEKNTVLLYKPIIRVGNVNKYDMVLTVEWGLFKKTIKISREYPNIPLLMVQEINAALEAGAISHPYETR